MSIMALFYIANAFGVTIEEFINSFRWEEAFPFPVNFIILFCLGLMLAFPIAAQIWAGRFKRKFETLSLKEQRKFNASLPNADMRIGIIHFAEGSFICREPGHAFVPWLYQSYEIVWIYPVVGIFQKSDLAGGLQFSTPVHSICFYTADGKKHSVFMGDYEWFANKFPNARKGYTKENKMWMRGL